MSGYLNKAILIGNLGGDPETTVMQGGRKIIKFSLATTEYWKDKETGDRRERSEWHRIVVFNDRLFTLCEEYLRKGTSIYLEGQIQYRKYTDKQGQERMATDIVIPRFRGEIKILSPKKEGDTRPYARKDELDFLDGEPSTPPEPELDDEIPF